MSSLYFVLILLMFVAAGIAILDAILVLRWRQSPGIAAFAFLLAAAGLWAFFGALELAAASYELKIWFAKWQYVGIVSIAPVWFTFSLRYTRQDSLLTWQRALLLWVIPAVSLALVFTNELHGLIWTEITPRETAAGQPLVYGHGFWFWILVVYHYFLSAAATLLLLWGVLRSPGAYRQQLVGLLVGSFIPWAVNVLYQVDAFHLGVDLTPVSFVVCGLIYTWVIFRFQIFDFSPITRDAVLESLSDGVVVLDAKRRVSDINLLACNLLELERNVIVGRPVEEALRAYPGLASALFEEGRIAVTLSKGEHFFDFRLSHLEDKLVGIYGQVLLLRDVTERERADERLRLLSYALEAAANGIVITDRQGVIQWVNVSFTELTGYTRAEAVGQKTSLLKSGAHQDDFYRNMWQMVLSGRSWRGEVINRRKDGSLYTEEQTIAPVRNDHGEIENFIAVKQDVSERKNLEQLRDDLISTIVHDLRNPLTSITMSLDLIQRHLTRNGGTNPAQEEILDVARLSARRMTGLVNAIMDISRLENERMPIQRQPIELARLVSEAIKFQMGLATNQGLEIRNQIPLQEGPIVAVDLGLVGRVLQNLIDNAIKFTPTGGCITIGADEYGQHPGYTQVFVADTGPGIPPDVQDRLFQKFASGNQPGHGTGLGLAFARLAVEAHGGRIWAETTPASGTMFCFTIPTAGPDDFQSA